MTAIHTRRLLLTMLMPGLFLSITYLFNSEIQHFFFPIQSTLPYVPYMLLFASMILAWGYNNGREFNLLLGMLICYWTLRQYIWQPNLPVATQSTLYALLTVIIPINFLTHVLLRERGVMRWQAARRFSYSLLQILLVIVIIAYPGQIQEYLRFALWQNPWPQHITLPQTGIIALLLAMLALSIQLRLQPNLLHGGLLMSLLAMMMGLNAIGSPATAMIYFSIAPAAVLIALVLNSYNLAYLDELTGLPSRRALKQHLLALGKRYSIAMIDIDRFKSFNDRYGHDVGDQVLRMIAAQLQKTQGGARVYRYGGEEFTIVFANKDSREALIYVDNIREAIAKIPFFIRDPKRPKQKPDNPKHKPPLQKVKITISGGIAHRDDHHATPFDVIKSADKALYTAKRGGRNQIRGT